MPSLKPHLEIHTVYFDEDTNSVFQDSLNHSSSQQNSLSLINKNPANNINRQQNIMYKTIFPEQRNQQPDHRPQSQKLLEQFRQIVNNTPQLKSQVYESYSAITSNIMNGNQNKNVLQKTFRYEAPSSFVMQQSLQNKFKYPMVKSIYKNSQQLENTKNQELNDKKLVNLPFQDLVESKQYFQQNLFTQNSPNQRNIKSSLQNNIPGARIVNMNKAQNRQNQNLLPANNDNQKPKYEFVTRGPHVRFQQFQKQDKYLQKYDKIHKTTSQQFQKQFVRSTTCYDYLHVHPHNLVNQNYINRKYPANLYGLEKQKLILDPFGYQVISKSQGHLKELKNQFRLEQLKMQYRDIVNQYKRFYQFKNKTAFNKTKKPQRYINEPQSVINQIQVQRMNILNKIMNQLNQLKHEKVHLDQFYNCGYSSIKNDQINQQLNRNSLGRKIKQKIGRRNIEQKVNIINDEQKKPTSLNKEQEIKRSKNSIFEEMMRQLSLLKSQISQIKQKKDKASFSHDKNILTKQQKNIQNRPRLCSVDKLPINGSLTITQSTHHFLRQQNNPQTIITSKPIVYPVLSSEVTTPIKKLQHTNIFNIQGNLSYGNGIKQTHNHGPYAYNVRYQNNSYTGRQMLPSFGYQQSNNQIHHGLVRQGQNQREIIYQSEQKGTNSHLFKDNHHINKNLIYKLNQHNANNLHNSYNNINNRGLRVRTALKQSTSTQGSQQSQQIHAYYPYSRSYILKQLEQYQTTQASTKQNHKNNYSNNRLKSSNKPQLNIDSHQPILIESSTQNKYKIPIVGFFKNCCTHSNQTDKNTNQ